MKSKVTLLLLLICGCTPRPSHIKVDDVDYIKFYTTNRSFETPCAIQSFDYFIDWNNDSVSEGSLCRDTIIRSRYSINHFIESVNSLKPSKNTNYDLRTVAEISLKDGSVKYIGFGYRYGTCMDGVLMKDNEDLFNYLEDSVYGVHPQEYWMGKWLKEINSGVYDSLLKDE